MEESDLSSENWHVWCRLCGSLGSQQHTNMFDIIEKQERVLVEDEQEISLLEAINIHLNLTITKNDTLSKMICPYCVEFMKNFIIYYKHVYNVQKVFKVIHENELVEWHELHKVRKKFGVVKKNSVAVPMLNAVQNDDIVSEVIADQLSCIPIQDEKAKYQQEKLLELVCNIEVNVSPKEFACVDDHIIWSNDNAGIEETFDNCTDNIEISYVQDTEKNSANNCQLIQTQLKPRNTDKSNTRLQKIRQRRKINVTCNRCHEHLVEKHNKQKYRRKWECPKCEKSFMSSNGLEHHLRNDTPINESYEFSCTDCRKQFPTKESLKGHIRYKHSLERYVCEICGVTIKNKTSLRLHKLTHSEHVPFECTICKRGFKYANLLKTHMEIHDNRKHICNICGLKLNTRVTLRRHMNVHNDIKKFKCDLCGRGFKVSKSLKLHLVSHTGIKLYTCDFCGLDFTNNANCRRHKINIHPEKWAALEKSGDNKKVIHRLPTIETLKELAAINFNNGNGKKQKKKRTNF